MNEELKKILEEWGQDTVIAMQAVLTAQKNVATGNLRRSIQYIVGENFVQFTMDEAYGQYVDEGTKPHWVPIAPLKRWASAKGLPKSAAFAARAAIKRRGTTPKRFFTTVIEKEIARLVPQLEQSIVQYFGDRIELLNSQP